MAIVDYERSDKLYTSEKYANNTNDWEDGAAIFRANALFQALIDAGILEKVESILDVGCGSGGVLVNFKKLHNKKFCTNKSIQLTGIDLSEKAIEVANRLYSREADLGVEFFVSSVDSFQKGNKYSLVTLIHVLEHCPDMLDMLGFCEKNGGYVYINVPIEVNLFYTIRRNVLMNQYLKYGHLHFFNERFFIRWLEENGFSILSKVYSADFEVNKPGFGYAAVKLIRRWLGKVSPPIATWLLGGYSLGILVRSRNVS